MLLRCWRGHARLRHAVGLSVRLAQRFGGKLSALLLLVLDQNNLPMWHVNEVLSGTALVYKSLLQSSLRRFSVSRCVSRLVRSRRELNKTVGKNGIQQAYQTEWFNDGLVQPVVCVLYFSSGWFILRVV